MSTRMRKDKGLLYQDGMTWAEAAETKLKQITSEVYISINSTQISKYQKIFPLNKLMLDSAGCGGPLAGLLSVHKSQPSKDILLLACDMVEMDVQTLMLLVEKYGIGKEVNDFFVFRRDGELEPLPGIYTCKGILKTTPNNGWENSGLKSVLEVGNTSTMDCIDAKKLANYNFPVDLTFPSHV